MRKTTNVNSRLIAMGWIVILAILLFAGCSPDETSPQPSGTLSTSKTATPTKGEKPTSPETLPPTPTMPPPAASPTPAKETEGKETQAPDTLQPDTIAELDAPFTLDVGQLVLLESENFMIEFLDVTEDSRCPKDVDCVWAGQATILLNLSIVGQEFSQLSLTLGYGPDDLSVKEFDKYTIHFLNLTPYPISTEETQLSDYNATLVISEK